MALSLLPRECCLSTKLWQVNDDYGDDDLTEEEEEFKVCFY